MSSEDRRRVSQELVDKIDALVGGHEHQRTYEPDVDPSWEDGDVDWDDWENDTSSTIQWVPSTSTIGPLPLAFVSGDFSTYFTYFIPLSFSMTFRRPPVPCKPSKHRYGR